VPLSAGEMSLHLKEVAEKENIKISQEALEIIAKKSGGSVRDALSLLDQASMKAGEKEITKEEISQMLSIVSQEDLLELYTSTTNGNATEVINSLQKIKKQGITEASILEEFLEYLYLQIHQNISNEKPYGQLLRLWNIFLKSTEELNHSFNKFAILEVIFLKGMHIFALPSVENLVSGISEGKILEILKQFPEATVEKK
jgi:DNA polymerase-3 subunit gamma/tau